MSIKDTVLFHLGQVELHDPLEGVRDSLDPRFGGTATPETVKSIGEIGASVLFLDHEGQEGMHHLGMHIDTLHANTGRYFEMHPDFMPIHAISPTRLEAMEARLAKLPLVHRTNADPLRPGPKESGGTRPIYPTPVPHSLVKNTGVENSNTYKLDQQLGLDDYVFMRWGAVYTRGKGDFLKGSRYAVLVDPDVLQDERTIATPWDIAARVSGSRMTDTYFDPKAIMTPRQFVRHKYEMHRKLIGDQQRVDLYMQAVVTGADWLDIEARRLLAKAYKARKPVEDMPVSAEDLGEVKFKGPLPRSAILAVLDTHNPKEYQMYVDYVRETAGIALEDTGRLERRFRK